MTHRTMSGLAASLIFAFSTTACVLDPPEPIPVPVDPSICGTMEGVHDYLEVDPRPARQGSTLRIAAKQWRGPALHDVPPHCTTDWSVSDPSLARLSDDRTAVHIAADAAPGAVLTIGYRVNGKDVRAAMTIVGKDAMVLTGRRGQAAAEGCDGLAPIGELIFTTGGGFSVTFNPFETYKDYWGSYRLDPATGALSMTVTGDNYRPSGLDLEGKARFTEDGKLVLEDMFLGQPGWGGGRPPASGTCRYIFG